VSHLVVEPEEQAAFRAEARALVADHARPKKEASMWELHFYAVPDEESRRMFRTRASSSAERPILNAT
jgi:hypothetical protein